MLGYSWVMEQSLFALGLGYVEEVRPELDGHVWVETVRAEGCQVEVCPAATARN